MNKHLFWARAKASLSSAWKPWHVTTDGETGHCGASLKADGDYTTAKIGTEGWHVKGRICRECEQHPAVQRERSERAADAYERANAGRSYGC